MLVFAGTLSHLSTQRVMNALPGAIESPLAKIVIDAFPLGILTRQHPPLDAADQHVKERVKHSAHVQFTGSSTRFWWWNVVFDKLPLTVCEVAGIELVELVAHTIQTISSPRRRSPFPLFRLLLRPPDAVADTR